MKKILFSILSLGIVAVVAIGATRAYFTAEAVLSENIVNTATVAVEVRGTPQRVPMTVSNLLPGVYSDWEQLEVINRGDVPIKYAYSSQWVADNIWGSHQLQENLYNEVWVQIEEMRDKDGTWSPRYNGWLRNLNLLEGRGNLGTVNPEDRRTARFRFTLPAGTGNEFQGLTSQFNIIVDATQTNNPGWSE